ncbi:MAG: hypothetical protein FH748_12550 [Balneolaceae bacterium]|nr:hypothetical protein [Balneolaceae bacterium]
MSLSENKAYFVNTKDEVLRIDPKEKTSRNARNHLILGDYVRYLGETKGEWVKVRSRGNPGWLKEDWLTDQQMLEVNFVDIGQGDGCHIVTPDDEIILIDAGVGKGFGGDEGDNMSRFINWRYNLRKRRVAGVDGVGPNDPDAKKPVDIDYAIISHPDLDHYYGFYSLFENKKLKFKKVCHNGIVERPEPDEPTTPWYYDLGRKIESHQDGNTYLWDTVTTDAEMKALLDEHEDTRKLYIKTLLEARKNNPQLTYEFLHSKKGYLDHFKENHSLSLQILGPIVQEVEHNGENRKCLVRFSSEGVTKNGHSIVFQLEIGKLKIMLGGDLNSDSQDYLAQQYSAIDTELSELEEDIHKYTSLLSSPEHKDESLDKRRKWEQKLDEARKLRQLIISKVRAYIKTDIAKACHHGASDVLDSFLHCIHPLATIISSGDNESHSHPRPDALGAFGKSSRGARPLIFSTELARSSQEFSYPIKFYSILKKIDEQIEEITDTLKAGGLSSSEKSDLKDRKELLRNRMLSMRESNVARYGMITIRTDGEKVIIAQKLEKARSEGQKWDIYELSWNPKLEEFEYTPGSEH